MRSLVMLISGLAVGLGIGLTAPDVNWGFTVGARPAVPSGAVMQWVDRSHKGDRLDIISGARVGRQKTPPPAQGLMDGCEPAASPLSASAQIAARCAA